MPRPKSLIPKLCIDKTRNRAFCKVDGKFVVLGPAGSAEAQAAYGNLLSHLANQGVEAAISAAKRRQSVPREPKPAVLLRNVFLRFATDELPKYAGAEQRCIKGAVKVTRELYGEIVAAEFGPLRLRTVRDAMIRKGWSRSFINKQVKRLRSVLRWGVGWELVPRMVVDSLADVKPLACGDSDARESNPRRAIPEKSLNAVRNELCERHRDIFDLLLLTGARPGELLNLTTGSIDRTGEIWRADLSVHKTAHKGKSRTLFFNAKAQLIIAKYLNANPSQRLFPIRGDTLSKAFRAACVKASVPEFTPHWLRHTVATILADEMGTEVAQRLLGHASKAMTEHYSRAAERQAIEAVKRLG